MYECEWREVGPSPSEVQGNWLTHSHRNARATAQMTYEMILTHQYIQRKYPTNHASFPNPRIEQQFVNLWESLSAGIRTKSLNTQIPQHCSPWEVHIQDDLEISTRKSNNTNSQPTKWRAAMEGIDPDYIHAKDQTPKEQSVVSSPYFDVILVRQQHQHVIESVEAHTLQVKILYCGAGPTDREIPLCDKLRKQAISRWTIIHFFLMMHVQNFSTHPISLP